MNRSFSLTVLLACLTVGCGGTDQGGGGSGGSDNGVSSSSTAHVPGFDDFIDMMCETRFACFGTIVDGGVDKCVAQFHMTPNYFDPSVVAMLAPDAMSQCGALGEVCHVALCMACSSQTDADGVTACVSSTPGLVSQHCHDGITADCPGFGQPYP